MAPMPAQLRYERKCLGQGLSLAEVVSIVRRHPALFREIYPPRAVNNIYLDSPGLRDYFDHVQGVADRLKTRIRWYGQLNGHTITPTLERKFKRGLVGGKLAHPLPALALDGLVTPHVLHANLERAEVPDLLRLKLRGMQPSLVNRYQRQYWLSACGRLRLTVDWDLQFFRLGRMGRSAIAAHPRTPMVIIELKFAPEHAEIAAEATNVLPLRISRCSKYVLGIERLGTA